MISSPSNSIRLRAHSVTGMLLLWILLGSTAAGQANSAKLRLGSQQPRIAPFNQHSQSQSVDRSRSRNHPSGSLRSSQSTSAGPSHTSPSPLKITNKQFLRATRTNPDVAQDSQDPKVQGQGFIHFQTSNSLTATEIQRLIDQTELELRLEDRQQRSPEHVVKNTAYTERPREATNRATQTAFVEHRDQSQTHQLSDSAWNFEAERIESSEDSVRESSANQSATAPTDSATNTSSPNAAESQALNSNDSSAAIVNSAESGDPSGNTSQSKSKNEAATPSDQSEQKSSSKDSTRQPFNVNETIKNVSFTTIAVLVVCVISIFALKKLGVNGNNFGRTNEKEMTVVNRTSLTNKCEVHLVQFKNHKIVVGVDQSGIKSMVCLPSSFAEELDGATDESRTL